ncbi:hypothetical protein [Conexibacter sp. SYSU D00693]|uniref:hypothetical protein n=1 Tax=Conexibacter sp. SYSU D00693 TaxID=2812560 RepID=UPI00196A78D5|nr:hypothetical protein [Conexibacter sp. SYSU D00693]
MLRSTLQPPAGLPDFPRRVDGSVRLPEGSGGAERLLVRLVADGLDPDALLVAAALVARLDQDAVERAASRRERARRGALARQVRRRALAA